MGEFEVFEDASALARAAAERFVSIASAAIEERGRCVVALASGAGHRAAYELLASEKFSKKVDWQRVHVFMTDEKVESREDPESTFRVVSEALLNHVDVVSDHVHPIVAEADPVTAASLYESELRDTLGQGGRLDLVFLDVGADGRTASILPGHRVLSEQTQYVSAVLPKVQVEANVQEEETVEEPGEEERVLEEPEASAPETSAPETSAPETSADEEPIELESLVTEMSEQETLAEEGSEGLLGEGMESEEGLDIDVDGLLQHRAFSFDGSVSTSSASEKVVQVTPMESVNIEGQTTLTLPVLNGARNVIFLVQGAELAGIAERIQADEELPAARVNPSEGSVIWMLDRAAKGSA